jgi:hypothetical protein
MPLGRAHVRGISVRRLRQCRVVQFSREFLIITGLLLFSLDGKEGRNKLREKFFARHTVLLPGRTLVSSYSEATELSDAEALIP